jgi:hypothetical protein
MWCDGHVSGSLGRCAHCAQKQLICGSAVRSSCAVKMSTGGNSRITAWRGLMASKGLSGAAPVLEGYGLSCEHDLSLLVQEDLNALSSQLTPFHSRILRTWVQGLAAADQHHKRDKKRAAGDVNDAPAAKKHSNAPPSAETLLPRRLTCRKHLYSEARLSLNPSTLSCWNPTKMEPLHLLCCSRKCLWLMHLHSY